MNPKYFYLIRNTNGVETVDFRRIFDKFESSENIFKLLNKISHYVNYFDDVTDKQSYELCSLVSKNFKTVRVDKSKLFNNKKIDRLYFEEVVVQLLEEYKIEKKVVIFSASGYYYFVFGLTEKQIIKNMKDHIYKIHPLFFERMNEKMNSLLNVVSFKVRKLFNVC